LFYPLAELLDVTGAVEHGIVSMKMKVDKLGHSGTSILLGRALCAEAENWAEIAPERLFPCCNRIRRLALPVQLAGINRLSRTRNGLKEKLVAQNLGQHEATIPIKAGNHDLLAMKVVVHQLSRTALDEVVDSVLGLDPLISVLVSGKDRIHAINL